MKVCKFCGKSNLHWRENRGKWVLVDSFGNRHTCLLPKKVEIKNPQKLTNFYNDPKIKRALAIFKEQLKNESTKNKSKNYFR